MFLGDMEQCSGPSRGQWKCWPAGIAHGPRPKAAQLLVGWEALVLAQEVGGGADGVRHCSWTGGGAGKEFPPGLSCEEPAGFQFL